MNNKDEIVFLYFEKKLNIIEISKKINVSKQYVSKIVRKDDRHLDETLRRKKENKIKQIERNKQCIKNKRKKEYEKRLDASMELQHLQAISELSGRKTIGNRAYRDWNSSIYQFNSNTKEYKLKDEFINKTSYAIPKRINWK